MGRRGSGAWQGSPSQDPCLEEGPQRLPSRDCAPGNPILCPARSFLPHPHSLQDSFLSAETLLPFPNPLTTSSPAPPGKGGRTLHPNLVLEQGKRGPQPRPETRGVGPFIILQRRAWGEPISHLINGRGGTPFHPLPKHANLVFSPGRDGAPFQPRRENPRRKRGPTSSLLQGRETSPAAPPRKNAPPTQENRENPSL